MNKGYVCIILATLFFSSMETVLKGFTASFHPLQLTLTRFLVGGIALAPFAWLALRRRQVFPNRRDILHCAGLGFLGVFVSMTFFQLAVETAPASVVAVLFSCNPVFVLLFARLLLGAAIRRDQYASLAFQVAGIVCLVNPLETVLNPVGIALTILSAAFFALYAVAGAKTSLRLSGMAVTCLSFLLGSAELLAVTLAGHIPAVAAVLSTLGLDMFAHVPLVDGYSASTILPMLFVCVGVTGLGYAFYFMGMELTSPVTTSLVFFFKPVLAPLLAWGLLGEAIPLSMKIGIALILVGSAIPLWHTRHAARGVRQPR